MIRSATKDRIGRGAVALLALTLVACGGGNGGPLGPTSGVVNANGSTDGPGGGGFTTVNPLDVQGGVLATFAVGNERFRAWVRGPAAQQLVDAFNGTGPAVTWLCADVVQGPGQGRHNAPWNWSVSTAIAPNFSGICFGCANPWRRPSAIEAGIAAGAPYNCKPVLVDPLTTRPEPPGPIPPVPQPGGRAMASMQVALTDVQDYR